MTGCWHADPKERTDFANLVGQIGLLTDAYTGDRTIRDLGKEVVGQAAATAATAKPGPRPDSPKKAGGGAAGGDAPAPAPAPAKRGSAKKKKLSACESEWLKPGAKKDAVEAAVLAAPQGSFLVRANKDQSKFFIVVKDQTITSQFAVTVASSVAGEKLVFGGKEHDTIGEIVDNLASAGVKGKSGKPVKLAQPAPL